MRILTGHKGAVTSLQVSPCGRLAATAGEDKRIKIWDLAEGKWIKVSCSSQFCGSMKFWYESVSGSADPYICLMDPDADPDPAVFVSDLQDIKKYFYFVFCLLFLHHFQR